MGTRVTADVYGMFAPLLPQRARAEHYAQPYWKRQGHVPDFLVCCRTAEGGPNADAFMGVKTRALTRSPLSGAAMWLDEQQRLTPHTFRKLGYLTGAG